MIGDEDSQERSDTLPTRGTLFRRWSPIFVPLVLGVLGVVAPLILIVRHVVPPTELLVDGGPVEFLAVAAVFGVILGVLLYGVTAPRYWVATLLAGGLLYCALLLAVSLGLIIGLVLIGGAAFAAFAYVRTHLWLVPDDVVVLIGRRGRYARTIYPGLNLLWPLERPVGTLPTGLHIYTSPLREVRRTAPSHVAYRVSASAVTAYAVIPAAAGHAAGVLESWEDDLRQLVDVALRDALQDWSHREIEEGGAVPENAVARMVLERVREDASAFGVWVAWVRICHIRVRRVDDAARTPTASAPQVAASVSVRAAFPVAVRGSAPSSPTAAARAQARILGESAASDGHDTYDEVELDPNGLTDLYNAVRAGIIHDPETIRRIAREFAEVAASTDLCAICDFNPATAADLLTTYAAKLEAYQRAKRTSMPSWPSNPGARWSDPHLQAVGASQAHPLAR